MNLRNLTWLHYTENLSFKKSSFYSKIHYSKNSISGKEERGEGKKVVKLNKK